jgi:hypothetical protein
MPGPLTPRHKGSPPARACFARRAFTASHLTSQPLARSLRCATKPSCDVTWSGRAPTAASAFSAATRLPSALPASRSARESAACS